MAGSLLVFTWTGNRDVDLILDHGTKIIHICVIMSGFCLLWYHTLAHPKSSPNMNNIFGLSPYTLIGNNMFNNKVVKETIAIVCYTDDMSMVYNVYVYYSDV